MSGVEGVWAWWVKSPGHCAPQLSLLQGKALGAYAACHLLSAQCEPENVLVVALLILREKNSAYQHRVREPRGKLFASSLSRPRPLVGSRTAPALARGLAPSHPQHADDVTRLVQLHVAFRR